MQKRDRWTPIYVVVVLAVAGVMAFSGQRAEMEVRVETPPASLDRLPDLVGTWEGSWRDSAFHVGGSLTWTVAQDDTVISANGTIDLTSVGWPGVGVEQGTASGVIIPNGRTTLVFDFSATNVGIGSGGIVGSDASGMGTVVPPMDFGDFDFEANVTDLSMQGTFAFTAPGSGHGIASLTKTSPVEPTSWGRVKERYRGGDQ